LRCADGAVVVAARGALAQKRNTKAEEAHFRQTPLKDERQEGPLQGLGRDGSPSQRGKAGLPFVNPKHLGVIRVA